MSEDSLKNVRDRLMPYMEKECGNNGVVMLFFMLTNIITGSTDLLCYGKGAEHLVKNAYNVPVQNHCCHLESIVSRKKQLLPKLMYALQI